MSHTLGLPPRASSLLGDALRRASGRQSRQLAIGIAFISLIVLAVLFAPWLSPHPPDEVHLSGAYAGPSAEYPLGQDSTGRDILSRLLIGGRLSILGPLFVLLTAILVGVPLGVAAGYAGGWIDGVIGRCFDFLFAFPSLLLAILIVATFGPGFQTAVVAIGITYVPLLGRVVRSQVLSESTLPYVASLRVQGYGPIRVCLVHLVPNLSTLIYAQGALIFGYALLDLAALSFLGLGSQPPTSDWGTMLAEAQGAILIAPLNAAPPAIMIVLAVVAVNLVADAISARMSHRA